MLTPTCRLVRKKHSRIPSLAACRNAASLWRTFSSSKPGPEVIFSGIQPTGVPHLGNYLGALQQWVKLQNTAPVETKLIYSVVDLHAITLPQDPAQLRQHKRECFAAILAIGIDPKRSIIFSQSAVPAHSELMWILSCTASMGYLSRMTQWKTKMSADENASPLSGGNKSQLKLGLFSYPVLQAADILVHRATHVPVGEDQSQHLEFARECATNFNAAYGSILKAPETILSPAKRVMSLVEPSQKMSKSHVNNRSRILITDTPEEIMQKVMKAKTDDINAPSFDPINRPGVFNLLSLLSHFDTRSRSPEELAQAYSNLDMRSFKSLVSDTVCEAIGEIGTKYREILERDDGKYVDHVEAQGAIKARQSADETMALVKEAVGF